MTSQIANHRRFTMVSSYAKLQKSSLWIFSHSFCRVLPFFEFDGMGWREEIFFVDQGLRDSDRERY